MINVTILGGWILLGWILSRLIIRQDSFLEALSIAFPLGAGIHTWALFLVSWAGLELNVAAVIGTYAALLLPAIILHLRMRRSDPRHRREGGDAAGTWLPLGVLAVLLVFGGYYAVGRSYWTWDAIAIWSIKGYGIALEGSIFAGEHWGAHALSYPLNIPLMISVFRLLEGDILPGSKLIFPLFLASALLGCYVFWARRRVKTPVGILGMILLGTTPIIFDHMTFGYANLPMTTYLVLGGLYALEGIDRSSSQWQVMSGLLLGLASWTRVDGFLYVTIVIIGVISAWLICKQGSIRWLSWLLPGAFFIATWLAFFRIYGEAGSQAAGEYRKAIAMITQGEFRWSDLRLILGYARRALFNLGIWGLLFPAGIIVMLLGWKSSLEWRRLHILAPSIVCIGMGILVVILFYLGSYSSSGLYGWLERGFHRAFFPAAFFFIIMVMQGAGPLRDGMASEERR